MCRDCRCGHNGGMTGSNLSSTETRRPALLGALAAAAVLLAGCGSSTTSESTEGAAESPSPTVETSAPPAPPRVSTKGRVNTVAGSTLSMAVKEGPATVVITPTTKIIQESPGQLIDIKPGSCVNVRRAASAPEGPPAPAKSITVSAAANGGKCAEASTDNAVRGTVAKVDGQTISVSSSDQPEPTAVSVDQATQYTKQATVSALVITPGACLSAAGTLDPGGALRATTATVGPLVNGGCPGA